MTYIIKNLIHYEEKLMKTVKTLQKCYENYKPTEFMVLLDITAFLAFKLETKNLGNILRTMLQKEQVNNHIKNSIKFIFHINKKSTKNFKKYKKLLKVEKDY